MRHYEVATEKTEDLAKDVQAYMASADGEKLLIKQGSQFAIIEARPGQGCREKPSTRFRENCNYASIQQSNGGRCYIDAWRILARLVLRRRHARRPRALGNHQSALRRRGVEHVATRADLDYLLHEMAGELSAGHIYVERGDEPQVKRKPGGFIGAEIVEATTAPSASPRSSPGKIGIPPSCRR